MSIELEAAMGQLTADAYGVVAMREAVASWMRANGFATEHGDTLHDLLTELTWQVQELRSRASLQSEKR